MALRVRVCRLSDVAPGELRAFAIPGVLWPVLVTAVGGRVLAFSGVCPHEDVSLAGGALERGMIVCPGHGYRFELASGRCEHDPDLELRRYPVTVIGDEVWADLL